MPRSPEDPTRDVPATDPVRESVDQIVSFSGGRLSGIASIWSRRDALVRSRFGGTSMLPTISNECEIEIRCGLTPSVGDVVAYERNDQLIVHRTIAISGTRVLTRGDASLIPDRPIERQRVLGVVERGFLDEAEIDLRLRTKRPAMKIIDSLASALLTIHPWLADAFVRVLRILRSGLLKRRSEHSGPH